MKGVLKIYECLAKIQNISENKNNIYTKIWIYNKINNQKSLTNGEQMDLMKQAFHLNYYKNE